ncbi:MAG: DUF11 domain-containing protein [Oscillospiraceae bacterium]|nr:DUF11 domain-containing protein [Oscillospiraceae bacterium]
MKKSLFAFVLILSLLLALPLSVSAEHLSGGDGWLVEFTKDEKLVSNFSSSSIADIASGLQPGDDVTFTITLRNTSGKTADWYILNEIVRSLEDSQAKANGGAYTYVLTYAPSAGSTVTIYDSETVGGELNGTEPEGLHGVDSALKNYIALESMANGKTGVVTLKVSLDGETQGNGYQDSMADLRMRFAVEVTPTNVVKTGDERMNISPFYIGMAVSGLLFMALAVDGILQRKKQGGESK